MKYRIAQVLNEDGKVRYSLQWRLLPGTWFWVTESAECAYVIPEYRTIGEAHMHYMRRARQGRRRIIRTFNVWRKELTCE